MKRSELEQIIKEEIDKILTENIARSGTGASLARASNRGIVLNPSRYEAPIGDPRGKGFNPDLKALHGDYKISSFPTHKLTEPVKIDFIADKDGVLKASDSLELKKDMPYKKGSAIMNNGKGKLWAIPPDDFKRTYTIDPGGKTATPVPQRRYAVQMREPFRVKPSWSNVPLHGKAGDFLVQYGPGDYGAVDADEFKKTYNTKAMPKSKPTSAKTKADPKAKTVSKQQLASEIEKAAKGKKVTKKAIMATLRPFAKVLGIASIGFLANAIVKKATNKDWGGVAEEILMASPAGIPIMVATGFFNALKNNMNKYGLEAAQDVARVKTNILDRL